MKTLPQIATIALLVLAGCEDSPTSEAAPRPVARKTAVVDAGTPADSAEAFVYQYNPVAKRDPFRPPAVEVGPVDTQCPEPLCQFELDQLTLVGVVTGIASPFAMVEDPQGKGYIIRRGSRMGRQGGKVTQILRDTVTVTEYWTAPDGKQNPNPVSLQLTPDRTRAPEMDLGSGKTF